MSLYDRLAATPDGARALAKARARHELLRALCKAVETAGGPAEFAKHAGVRTGRVRGVLNGDGDVRINLLADWLHAAGHEITFTLVPAGQPRADVMARREAVASERHKGVGDQRLAPGAVRPPLVTVQQETLPPPSAPTGDR